MYKNYALNDLLKFIFALFILTLHSGILILLNPDWAYYIEKIFFRLGVPFFFITSGYFLGRKIKSATTPSQAVIKYCQGFLKPYLIFLTISVIQMTIVNYSTFDNLKDLFLDQVKHILFSPYNALWYIWASIVASLILIPFVKKGKINHAFVISILLYGFALLSNSYYFVIADTPFSTIVETYIHYFITARNGLFLGLFYITLGIKLFDIIPKINLSFLYQALVIMIPIYIFEIYFVKSFNHSLDDSSIYLSHMLLIPIILALSVKIDCQIKSALFLRKLSTAIYFLHRPIIVVGSIVIAIVNATIIPVTTDYKYIFIYLFTLSLSFLLSIFIIKKDYFKYLF